ncbi:inositol monophosphatase family protein [Tropicibacter oceani]|uniref:3'(2'),5'-bisphosphate nucleotidase CysQ n=1 Tax=Tropicibacter oceani TaxID=3058420 RepID=A0ABY8QHP5_9RHOB|nr:3'(2'),5'-bisphosphate nucleotidase CysQ [Tropicibacter oceani]WGW04045.1 3'(2'),5'-bisphosphate nucleotidase CysQ [Tropicibacter oceani]
MPANDLTLLIEAAKAAGKEALSHVGGDLAVRHKDDGAGPVTKADLAVNALLEDKLRRARPDYGWLSEESADSDARLDSDTLFIVDPIDGTRSFIEGSDTWAHALAVVQNRQVTAAVVYLPARDKLYSASVGGGARLNGAPIRTSRRDAMAEIEVLATKPSLEARFWPRGVPEIKRSHRPSLAYRLSLVAEGRYDAMFTFRPSWEWDIAAGALILSEAGARVSDRRGAPLRFNNPMPQTDGVLAANPRLHAALLDQLL